MAKVEHTLLNFRKRVIHKLWVEALTLQQKSIGEVIVHSVEPNAVGFKISWRRPGEAVWRQFYIHVQQKVAVKHDPKPLEHGADE